MGPESDTFKNVATLGGYKKECKGLYIDAETAK